MDGRLYEQQSHFHALSTVDEFITVLKKAYAAKWINNIQDYLPEMEVLICIGNSKNKESQVKVITKTKRGGPELKFN